MAGLEPAIRELRRGTREQVQWTCESSERSELKRAAAPLCGRSTGQKPHWGFCYSGLTDGRVKPAQGE
jgi:hypothetical protein